MTRVRVKTEPNGSYTLVSESEYEALKKASEEGLICIYESYVFTEVREEEDGSTGVNYWGKRVVIEAY